MGDGVGGYQSPRVTSDGRYVSYASFDQGTWRSPTVGSPAHSGGIRRVHVLDLATGQDSAIPIAADPTDPSLPVDQWEPRFSPDGKMLVFQTDRSDGTDQIAVAHTDGSDIPRPLGPSAPTSIDPNDENVSFEFSPDGTKVIARYPAEGVLWALPVDGSPGSTLPWDAVDLPSMQRLAP
jgi:Tol biopolymer transport system component